jgi:hypothetical protein
MTKRIATRIVRIAVGCVTTIQAVSVSSDTYWSLKCLSNSRHVIGSYFDKLLGVKTLCIWAKNHFEKLDTAYAAFVDEYDGSYKPSGAKVLSWKNPWNVFLDGCCHWKMQKDTGDNDIEYTCILLPTIIVRDFWLLWVYPLLANDGYGWVTTLVL